MSPASFIGGWGLWVISALLGIILPVLGWTAARECARNDEQDRRIQAVEKACVRLDFMASDIAEIKMDVKTIRDRGHR